MSRRRWIVALAVPAAVLIAALLVRQRHEQTNTRGAKVVRYTLASRVLGRRLREVAVIPRTGGPRPLLVLLHGRHDPPRLSWLVGDKTGPERMLSDALFAGLARLGRRAPVVVVLDGGGHSYYHDRRDGRWGSMILEEAIPDAVRRFGTAKGRVAIGGISMGGYGALHLAASRPFCAVGGHSAALWESGGASAPGAFDDAEDFARNDVLATAGNQGAAAWHGAELWLDGGTEDPFHTADEALASALRIRMHVWPGGHEHEYWVAHYGAYLRFYARALKRCRH